MDEDASARQDEAQALSSIYESSVRVLEGSVIEV